MFVQLVVLLARADPTAVASELYSLSPPPAIVGYLAGGGTQLVADLLTTPGASKAVLELTTPYATAALADALNDEAPPQRACTPDVAHRLAVAAFDRALALGAPSHRAVGFGCTAALATQRLRRGEHRCFIAVHTRKGTHSVALTLAKGARSRSLEDAVVARCVLQAIATACGLQAPSQPNGREFWRLWPEDAPSDGHRALEAEVLSMQFDPA